MIHRHVAGLGLVLLATACASAGSRDAVADAGCYQFRWDAGAKALGLPWGVVLLDEPLESSWPVSRRDPSAKKALTATSESGRADAPFGYWLLTSSDSVEIGHPGGLGGFSIRLGRSGEDLVGRGSPVGDVLRPGETPGPRPAQQIVAQKVLCSAS
jgi:hypothetical protein